MAKIDLQQELAKLLPGETRTVIGRCSDNSRHGLRLDVEGITILAPGDNGYDFGNTEEAPRGFVVPEGCRWIGTAAWLRHYAPACPHDGGSYKFTGLKAILSTNVHCGAGCDTATSAECKCSCGGANHGVHAR